jgi:hypothetical protein
MTSIQQRSFLRKFFKRTMVVDVFDGHNPHEAPTPWQDILAGVGDNIKAMTADEAHRIHLLERQTELYERDAEIVYQMNRLGHELAEVRHTIRSVEAGLKLVNEPLPLPKQLPTLVEARKKAEIGEE